ncbi:hypothetical protein [Pseudomonas aeruginosa]|uniref:hypothetical protein n=1 Tax=Pseudomonas aeruginosa TaxID=287 RepID=UPI0031FEA073
MKVSFKKELAGEISGWWKVTAITLGGLGLLPRKEIKAAADSTVRDMSDDILLAMPTSGQLIGTLQSW